MQCRKGIFEAQDYKISVDINDEPRTGLQSLMFMSIESDIMEGLHTEKLVQDFVDISPRRMNLI